MMKSGTFILVTSAALVLLGCAVEMSEAEGELSPEAEQLGSVSSALEACPAGTSCFDYTDSSSSIHIRIYRCPYVPNSGPVEFMAALCTVGAEHALVGGGAEIEGSPEPGALLRASFPAGGDGWVAMSQSHVQSSPHRLRAYAIGMRLKRNDGTFLTKAQLNESITRDTALGPVGARSTASATVAPQRVVLSGGGLAPADQFLIVSVPDGNSWGVTSKDHVVSAPGSVTAYALSIQACPMHWGHCLEARSAMTFGPPSTGYVSHTWNNPDNIQVVTGPGGYMGYNGFGRMMTDIVPLAGGSVRATSKDHLYSDSGQVYTFVQTIRRVN